MQIYEQKNLMRIDYNDPRLQFHLRDLSGQIKKQGGKCLFTKLPDKDSSDIDIFIQNRGSKNLYISLKENTFQRRIGSNTWYIFVPLKDDQYVPIDCQDCSWLSDSAIDWLLLNSSQLKNGIYLANPSKEICVTVLKELRTKNRYRENRLKKIHQSIKEYGIDFSIRVAAEEA